MLAKKEGLHECMMHLRKVRPCIWPNEGFYKQLVEFEKELGLVSKLPKPPLDFVSSGFH